MATITSKKGLVCVQNGALLEVGVEMTDQVLGLYDMPEVRTK